MDLFSCAVNSKGWNSPDFEVIAPSRIFTLRCGDVEERDGWVQAINVIKKEGGAEGKAKASKSPRASAIRSLSLKRRSFNPYKAAANKE